MLERARSICAAVIRVLRKKKCGDGDVMAPGERESDLNYSLVVSSLLDRAGAVPSADTAGRMIPKA